MSPTHLTDHERSVLDHLDEHHLLRSLAELVRVPSVSGTDAEYDVQDLAADQLRESGMQVDRWDIDLDELTSDPWFPGAEVERDRAAGVVGILGPADEVPELVLQAHLDVVPPGDPESWGGNDPFSSELHGGSLYGRGSCDMKAGATVNLAVARTLRSAGVEIERPLAVHCVTGEEDGGMGAFATLRRGHRGRGAVITEPTGGRMVIANAGALTFRIEVLGRSAHGSLRREGTSAFEAFLPVHQALLDLEAERNVDVDPLFADRPLPYALSLGVVRTGDWSSSVPDKLVAEGRFGIKLDEDPRSAKTAFEDAVNEASVKDPWLRENRPMVTWPGGQFSSGRIDPAHPLIRQVRDAVLAGGAPQAPPVGAEVYGSDLRLYAGVGGIPTLHYGPGDPRLAHAPNEHVELDEVVDVARSMVLLALRRCGSPRG